MLPEDGTLVPKHVADTSLTYLRVFHTVPHATRLKGRLRLRWDDDVRDDLRKMGVNNWKQKAQERKPWRGITEQAKTHKEFES